MHEIVLRAGRERPVRAGHPWIFSGAIETGLDDATPGDLVRVRASDGAFLAIGYANPATTIAVRVLSCVDEDVDDAFVARRIAAALELRRVTLGDATACRVVNGEGDRLPGVVVDRYGDVLVCQFLTAGGARLAPAVVRALDAALAPRTIFERSDGAVRREEGLAGQTGVLAGAPPPERVEIEEAGARFLVDVVHGQKTGFFLDQRESRARVRALAGARRVLNAFAYTGAISISAALGGATDVVSIDSSRPALEIAEAAWLRNGLAPERAQWLCGNVFEYLRAEPDRFGLVVVDPPPFVRRRDDLAAGLRGYKDVNLQALRHVEEGGFLLTCSCSQHVPRDAFRDAVGAAAADARRPARIVAEWGHPPDHPVLLAHPEGRYFKAMLLQA
ncbi:MAG TPA: class I SAM-dependent rRNA methyltransferase [Candidatus Eisenbacteria bacterium]|nr:class I SAM-dependent rRNA methyltransferase [Candidatus Eisenbacteria bacterium]